MKVPRTLQPLLRDGLIEEVVRPLMKGKEAAVYVVVAHGKICCAKVYKDAMHRSFKARAVYQEGRSTRNSRRARAMQRGTRYGKRELEEDWQNAEVDALYRLAAAGVRVPQPLDFTGGVLLMELITDAEGDVAPRLNDVTLTPETAKRYHATLLRDVVKMLCVGLVHGDLSEYNVLVDADGPVIIDLPQAIDAAANNNAPKMLKRDVGNLAAYFGRFVPELRKTDYGKEIWQLYETGRLTPETELTGKYQRKTKEVDVASVLGDIDDARRDAERRDPQRHAPKRREKRDEAWRGVVPDALPEDEGDPWAAHLIVSPTGTRKIVDLTPRRPPKPTEPPAAAKKKRRRRRRKPGEGGPAGAPPQAMATPGPGKPPTPQATKPPRTQGDAAPKPRRRRRRRRKAPAAE